jgi:hypothetical protein
VRRHHEADHCRSPIRPLSTGLAFSPVLISGDFALFSGQTVTGRTDLFHLIPKQQFRDDFSFLTADVSAAELPFDDVVG